MRRDSSVLNTLHHFGLNDKKIHQEMSIAGAWKVIIAEIQQLLGMRGIK